MTTDPENPLLTVREAAAYLRVCPEHVLRMIREGKLAAASVSVGKTRRWRILKDNLRAIVGGNVTSD
jgi:excisionase family DNA binding protein